MATNRIGESPWPRIGVLRLTSVSPDILDPALLRPGRIDRKIEFPPPGPEARATILRIHSRKVRAPHLHSRHPPLQTGLSRCRCRCSEGST
jgi:SpoVK/Ycf46/Vps4 family AAA+-type ATPase